MSYDASVVTSDNMLNAVVELGYRPSIVSSVADLSESKPLGMMPTLVSTALREARTQNQHVFIDFHAPWCGACKKLEATTLSDPDVQAALTQFVVLKIDTDEYPSIGNFFGVVGLPTIIVLDASGETRYRHAGPIDAGSLESTLLSKSLVGPGNLD